MYPDRAGDRTTTPVALCHVLLTWCDMKTLYLRNVPDDVVERLERLAARDGSSVSAVATRELAEVSRRADNPALLGALPDFDITTETIVAELDSGPSRSVIVLDASARWPRWSTPAQLVAWSARARCTSRISPTRRWRAAFAVWWPPGRWSCRRGEGVADVATPRRDALPDGRSPRPRVGAAGHDLGLRRDVRRAGRVLGLRVGHRRRSTQPRGRTTLCGNRRTALTSVVGTTSNRWSTRSSRRRSTTRPAA